MSTRILKSILSSVLIGCLVLLGNQLGLIATMVHAAENCDNIGCNKESQSTTDYIACIQRKQSCLQANINEAENQAVTLKGTISVLNGKINLQLLQIDQTETEIQNLDREITDLTNQIAGLNFSLDQLSTTLIKRVDEQYKTQRTHPSFLLLVSDSFNEFLTNYKYIQLTESQTASAMQRAETQKTEFDLEKQLKQQKQDEVAKKKLLLEQEKVDLTGKRTAQQNLLTQTNNNEKRFQELLSQAQAELASFRNFSTSRGGGMLPPQNSPDGWYFSQRDQRWGGACIGNSCGTSNSATIYEVGCLISSVAMVKKKYGEDVTPLTIASNGSYFFSNTADMVMPWAAPSGYRYARSGGYGKSTIDSELSAGRPVIIHLKVGPYGSHFIVLKSGSNGDYTMHDPYEGYDKKFTDFYNIGQIVDYSYLQKT